MAHNWARGYLFPASYSALQFQRPPNYTSADHIYPHLREPKLLNLQGITLQFVVLFMGGLKFQHFVYTYCQQPLEGSCNYYEEGVNMSDLNSYGFGQTGTISTPQIRNRVLRNTYALLALTMVPTVIGAWLGVAFGLNFMAGSPFLGFIVFMAIAFGFFWAIEKNKDTGAGVLLLLAFTFFMGIMMSGLVGYTLNSYSNGATLIMLAFGGTGAIFAVMATIATVSKSDFSGMGKWLMVGVLLLIVASLANIWLQLPALMLTVMVLAIAIFSAFILVDVQRIINGGETNYVMATLAIYLDVYNVFTNLLALLGIVGGDRD